MDKRLAPVPRLKDEAESKQPRVQRGKTALRPAEDLPHDLQVQKIELEMKNQALRQARVALEHSRDRYLDLHEFAPLGYLTLDRNGLIAKANLAGAALL